MRAALLAAAALAAAPCGALELTAKNLGFDRWDAQGRPEGWGIESSTAYTVERDCAARREGRCTLRIASRASVPDGEFQALAQSIGAGPAAGHALRLSGWIRTAGVSAGRAALWMRVEVERKVIVLENMLHEGPRASSEWQRFAIAVPVASNATLVALGVLLSGPGSAWFDDLTLEVDASASVGDAQKTRVVDPPRPRPSQSLAGDAALTLPVAEAAGVRDGWREQVRRDAHPIRSLASDDFSDLQFLKPLLAGKRVVQLGESAHGTAEFAWLKVRLAKFLHREMGFDVIAFESSLTACDLANTRVGISTPVDVMRDCVHATWHSTETLGLFEYLDAERRAGRRIDLAGFDVQASGRARAEAAARLLRQVERVDSGLASRLRSYEPRISPPLAPEDAARMMIDYAEAAGRVNAERAALAKLEPGRPLEVEFAVQEALSRVRFVAQLGAPDQREGSRIRDEGMADNLDFLLDRAYPGRKVVVWAHNFHIEKRARPDDAVPMGASVARRRGAEVYTLGLYMGRGVATWNDHARYEIVAPAPGTLESVLVSAGWRMSCVDFSRAAPGSWVFEPLTARDWGVRPFALIPALSYDGVVFVDTITPPEYF